MESMTRLFIFFISLFTQGFLSGATFVPAPKKLHGLSAQPKFSGRTTTPANNIPKTPVTELTARNPVKAPAANPTIPTRNAHVVPAEVTDAPSKSKAEWIKNLLQSETVKAVEQKLKEIVNANIKELVAQNSSLAEAVGYASGDEDLNEYPLYSPEKDSNDDLVDTHASQNEYTDGHQEADQLEPSNDDSLSNLYEQNQYDSQDHKGIPEHIETRLDLYPHREDFTEKKVKCLSLVESRDFQDTINLIADSNHSIDKSLLWSKTRYLCTTGKSFPMNEDPYSWERNIHHYRGFDLNRSPIKHGITLINHSFYKTPLVGFVEEVMGDQLCISQWNFESKKITVGLYNSKEAIYFIHHK